MNPNCPVCGIVMERTENGALRCLGGGKRRHTQVRWDHTMLMKNPNCSTCGRELTASSMWVKIDGIICDHCERNSF